jgi:hypothetical protein
MAIEHACMRVVRKPWGNTDLRPWSEIRHDGGAIGELWFQRPDMNAPDPALLLKLLFTKEPLSIQVHPDDAFAQSIGLGHGKTEAWYNGLKGLVAYLGTEPSPSLLHNLDGQNAGSPIRPHSRLPLHHRATAGAPARAKEVRP